ncbi:MAG: type II toxin-antitoxin system VapC family toxin [Firmicutes bacterium]|nr:type II toxin-antitoxin system VapC family toxin [Bacillota bacterium]
MYLVDSSVILKWFFPDEEGALEANELYVLMQSGAILLSTDSSVIHEVANVLHSKGKLSAQEIAEAISKMFNDGLRLIEDDQHMLIDAIKIGFAKKVGTHDAVLIASTMKNGTTLITADHLLHKVAKEYTRTWLL